MLLYGRLYLLNTGVTTLRIEKYTAKIGQDNLVSINLFESRFGFKRVSESAIFREITFELVPEETNLRKMAGEFNTIEM